MGTFDLFHSGHAKFLERCRMVAGAGTVTVGLNTDDFAGSYKRPPVVPYDGRRRVLLACRYVDAVEANAQPDGSALDVLGRVRPDAVCAGMDWYPSEGRDWFAQIGVPRSWFAQRGVAVVWLPYTEGVSTTALINAMAA
jgi:glycerol-3-phosphate cytidylyltransferase